MYNGHASVQDHLESIHIIWYVYRTVETLT